MAWTTPVDYSTGQVITAAIWNNLIGSGGNIDETAPAKVTTAGDLVYGTGTNAISRLGIGSANTVLKSSGSAPAWGTVATTELSAGNDKVFYSNSSGVVTEIALGGANTVLTSSGATSAPSFAAAAGGGGSVQMTSSGSITAGNLVALSAADTVKEVTDTRVAPTVNTNTTYSQGFRGSSYSSGMVWDGDTTTPTVLATWIGSVNSNWYVQAGTYATNTVTWGTAVEVGAGTTWWSGGNNAIYDSTNSGWWTWAGTTGSGYYPYVNFNTVSGTTVTAGTPVVNTQGYSAYYYINATFAHDTTNNKTLFAYSPSGTLYYQPFTVSGTTVTIGATAIYQTGGSYRSPAVFWNATYARMVVMGTSTVSGKISMAYRSYDSGTATYTATNINGTTHIESSDVDVSAANYNNAAQGFDMGSNRYVYVTNTSSYYLIVTCLTADSASTGTIGTTSIFDGSTATSVAGTGVGQTITIKNNGNWQASYDQTSESLIIFASDKDSSKPLRIHTLKYNAASDLWAQAGPTVSVTDDGAGGTADSFNGGATAQVVDSSGNQRAIWGASGTLDAAGATAENYLVYTGAAGTTDARDVIGVSADTVGTGVAVNVNVVGGVNENVTGLTSNAEYYIQGDGTLATSEDTPNYGKLGRALATDKLLITGIGDPTVSNT